MENGCKILKKIHERENSEGESELMTFICDNTDGVLDPLDQIIYGMNEVQVQYGSVVVLKDAP